MRSGRQPRGVGRLPAQTAPVAEEPRGASVSSVDWLCQAVPFGGSALAGAGVMWRLLQWSDPPLAEPSAHPAIHPSVCMMHHTAPFGALRPAHHWAIQHVSGYSSVSGCNRHRTAVTVRRGVSWRSAIISGRLDVFYGHPGRETSVRPCLSPSGCLPVSKDHVDLQVTSSIPLTCGLKPFGNAVCSL